MGPLGRGRLAGRPPAAGPMAAAAAAHKAAVIGGAVTMHFLS